MRRIITIEDVAKAAGVGKGTVDRVLHNRGKVAPETLEKVNKALEELNYKPNIAARMLANTKHYRIAICYHDKEKEFWNQVGEGVTKAKAEFEAMGVEVDNYIIPQIDVDRQLADIRRIIEADYDGLAIVPYHSKEIIDAINEAVDKGMAVVTFNNREDGIRTSYVGMDGYQSGKTAGRLMSLTAPKNARCSIVSSHSTAMAQIDERAIGFQEIIHRDRKDMSIVGSYVFEEDYDEVYNIVTHLLKQNKVEAIYATNECVSAVGRAVYDSGKAGSVVVIGHDITPTVVRGLKNGSITASVGQDPVQQGYSAVNKICGKLLRDETITDEYTRISIAVSENTEFI